MAAHQVNITDRAKRLLEFAQAHGFHLPQQECPVLCRGLVGELVPVVMVCEPIKGFVPQLFQRGAEWRQKLGLLLSGARAKAPKIRVGQAVEFHYKGFGSGQDISTDGPQFGGIARNAEGGVRVPHSIIHAGAVDLHALDYGAQSIGWARGEVLLSVGGI